jgi:hypothetical protein
MIRACRCCWGFDLFYRTMLNFSFISSWKVPVRFTSLAICWRLPDNICRADNWLVLWGWDYMARHPRRSSIWRFLLTWFRWRFAKCDNWRWLLSGCLAILLLRSLLHLKCYLPFEVHFGLFNSFFYLLICRRVFYAILFRRARELPLFCSSAFRSAFPKIGKIHFIRVKTKLLFGMIIYRCGWFSCLAHVWLYSICFDLGLEDLLLMKLLHGFGSLQRDSLLLEFFQIVAHSLNILFPLVKQFWVKCCVYHRIIMLLLFGTLRWSHWIALVQALSRTGLRLPLRFEPFSFTSDNN